MKTFFLKLAIFFLCFISLDQLNGFVFSKLYDNVKSGVSFTTNYALYKSNEDILIFGASEVTHGLISNQINDSLKMTCYNLGMDGQGIYYQYAVLNELLKRHKPKIVIISTFVLSDNERQTFAPLYPYYYNFKSIKDLIDKNEPNEKYKLLIKSYAYNSILIDVLKGNLATESNTNGFVPLSTVNKNMQLSSIPWKISTSTKTWEYYEKFIQSCLRAKCKVYIIDTPRYIEKNDAEQNLEIRSMLEKYSVNYLNYATDTTFINHPELFKDVTHLNLAGAKILTNLVIKDIKQQNLITENKSNY